MKAHGIVTVLSVFFIGRGVSSQCGEDGSQTFARWSGVAPEDATPVFVYAASSSEESLAGACLARCLALQDCAAVLLVYNKGSCTGVAAQDTLRLVSNSEAAYFKKTCMTLPKSCEEKWWTVEVTPAYHLHSEDILNVITNTTAQECYGAAIRSYDNQIAKSAQWVSADNGAEAYAWSAAAGARGSCLVFAQDKFTEPESYRVSNHYTLYIENQCQHDYPRRIDRCSYEEYYNQTLRHAEFTLRNQTKEQCKSSCERESRFVCRGFTWSWPGVCDLHSEDLVTTGSWLLRRSTTATYYRRVICLNITVECQGSYMAVTYRPRGAFRGRVYVPGRGEQCSARGGDGPVTLKLPLYGDCDVNFAFAISNGPSGFMNRTMAYVMLMVQNNPIIQAAGDRWVRVGCSPGAQPHARIDAAVAVKDSRKPGPGSAGAAAWQGASAVLGASSAPLTMYVVRGADAAGAVALGEPLDLRVETTEDAEIEVYHLVASSRLGDSSVLLLDSRGCPTGQVDFPQFTRVLLNGTQRLTARFKAFRFPNSHVVRFSLVVRFCEGRCAPVNCDPQQFRSARQTNESVDYEDPPESLRAPLPPGVVAQGGRTQCGAEGGKVPLELEMVVGSKDVISADTLVHADSRIPESSEAGGGEGEGGGAARGGAVVCIHELVLVALALAWLAVQLLLLLAGCVLVTRYRNLAEMNMQKDYQSFDNVGFDTVSTHRRVHWPDQHLDSVLS